VGAEGVHGAFAAGVFELPRQRGQVLVGGQHRQRRQIPPGDGGGASVLGPPFYPGLPQGLLLALAGGGRVGGDHGAAGGLAQGSGVLCGRGSDDHRLHRSGVLVGQAGQFGDDDVDARQVNIPSR
jgi:hypothetical protein